MADPQTSPPDGEFPADNKPAKFVGEEGGDERSTPAKNLGAAVVIAVIAILAMFLALQLDSPDTVFTAPGLLPFVTGASLLVMAIYLGYLAIRDGGAENYAGRMRTAIAVYFGDTENRRGLLLMAIIVIYITLVGLIDFDLRLPTAIFTFQLSSYEVISVPAIALILWIFWRGPVWKCVVISLVTVEVLAWIFRYAFYILMPTGG